MNAPDQVFARHVPGVGLACEHHLERIAPADAAHPPQIPEEEIRALVASHPAGTPDDRHVHFHTHARGGLDLLEKETLGLLVGAPQFLVRNLVRANQKLRLVEPSRDVAIEQLGYRRRSPGLGVDSIGDGVHVVSREESRRDLRMPFGYAVDVPAQAQREPSHIQTIRSRQGLKLLDVEVVSKNPADELVRKLVRACFHRGVCGEDALLAHAGQVVNALPRLDLFLLPLRLPQELER